MSQSNTHKRGATRAPSDQTSQDEPATKASQPQQPATATTTTSFICIVYCVLVCSVWPLCRSMSLPKHLHCCRHIATVGSSRDICSLGVRVALRLWLHNKKTKHVTNHKIYIKLFKTYKTSLMNRVRYWY